MGAQKSSSLLFRHMDDMELSFCLACNRLSRTGGLELPFVIASRLGDGVFWYALMVCLPLLYGRPALPVSLRMAAAGAVGVVLYKLLKASLVRQRPFITHVAIRRATVPLDLYSFPSGHTLHAVAFSTVALSAFPALGWLLIPFATLVAASRVVLGLHYPSDVLVGAALGYALGYAASVL